MYSITSEDTFKELQSVRDRILSVKESEEIPPMVLVGNKCDLEEVRQGAPRARGHAGNARSPSHPLQVLPTFPPHLRRSAL